jgi:hypothetical protein
LIQFLIGEGFTGYLIENSSVVKNFNKNFLMPSQVTSLLGMNNYKSKSVNASMLFNYFIGVQKFNNVKDPNNLAGGLNPEVKTTNGHFFESNNPPTGTSIIHAEPWAQVTAWSILNQYSNSLLNEMFTTFKLTPQNKVMPCVVFRQKPFTSRMFKAKNSNILSTEFLSLPRWKLNPNIIYNISVGRDDVARINFVHVITKSRHFDIKDHLALQASAKTAQMDENDVQRNGLRPFISSSDFDYTLSGDHHAIPWNKLVFDWLSNGHLKENGTVHTVGIEDPIAVGDNCQIEDTVYHIESITHSMQIDGNGHKKFDTTLQLSYGVDYRESSTPAYAEMQYSRTEDYRKDNWDRDHKTMPGFSDSQDVGGRSNGEKVDQTSVEEEFASITKKLQE